MDGALASLVGGLARGPVIGVPTSVGYGSAHGGTTALNAMLASCAAGLAVVGIDDGLGAGTIAARHRARARVSRVAYLDCVGGLAGDMLIAALLDAGAELETLRRVPDALGIEGVEIDVERVERQGIGALHLRIDAAGDHAHRHYRDIRDSSRMRTCRSEPARGHSTRFGGSPRSRAAFTAFLLTMSTSTSSARSTRSSMSAARSSSWTSSASSVSSRRRSRSPAAS